MARMNAQIIPCVPASARPTSTTRIVRAVRRSAVLKQLPVNREIEDVKYVKGAVLWCIDRKLASKSRRTRIVGSDLYKNLTIRNPNTVRKLYKLMQALDERT